MRLSLCVAVGLFSVPGGAVPIGTGIAPHAADAPGELPLWPADLGAGGALATPDPILLGEVVRWVPSGSAGLLHARVLSWLVGLHTPSLS